MIDYIILKIYDKGKEVKNRHGTLPDIYKGVHLLRIETRYTHKGIGQVCGQDLRLFHLTLPEYITAFGKHFRKTFFRVHRLPTTNTDNFTGLSFQEVKDKVFYDKFRSGTLYNLLTPTTKKAARRKMTTLQGRGYDEAQGDFTLTDEVDERVKMTLKHYAID